MRTRSPARSTAPSFAFLLALLLALASCASSTSIEESWRAPDAEPGELQNVVTLFVSDDVALRRSAEDELARQLSFHRVRAVPAYAILSDEDLQDPMRALTKLRTAGFQGIIAMRIASADVQLAVVPDTFDAYWDLAWPSLYGAEVVPEEVVRIETNAYTLTEGQRHIGGTKLLWSASSRTVDPTSVPAMIDDVSRTVAAALAKQDLIG
jgi:hypothetical protein